MRFRPCIDLHDGKVKQIVGSTLSDAGTDLRTNFVAELDSADYARRYREDALPGGHIIKLGPGNDAAARRALAAWPGGMQLGGGVTLENAADWLDAGASQIIVTSWVFRDGMLEKERLAALLRAVGRERLVLDLSCRKRDGAYFIVTDRWQKFTHLKLDPGTMNLLAESCCEFLVHAVDVEGKQAGADAGLIAMLARSPIPVTYAGGIVSFEDIEKVRRLGEGRVDFTIGSALDLFGGRLPYREVLDRVRA